MPDDDDDDVDDDEIALASVRNGSGFVDPRIGTGPSGFGGFAPRQPVTMDQGERKRDELDLGFDGMDDLGESEDEGDDDAQDDGMEDSEDDQDVEEVEDQGRYAIERLKEDV